jgi:hypothetical protein
MRTLFISLLLAIAGMLHGCAVLAPASVLHSCTVTRSGGVTYYSQGCAPPVPVYGQQPYSYGYGNKDIKARTESDDLGLKKFWGNETRLHQYEYEWLLNKIEELKGQCSGGATKVKHEVFGAETANAYSSSRSTRGDITFRFEYQCNRTGSADRPAPRSGQSMPSTTPETKPAPLSVPRLKGTSV